MSEPTVETVRNPYPGLRPFRSDEKHLFFGREQQVDRMVEKLAAHHFLAVVGGSGSGKSSLVNCGLRPALHRGNMASAGAAWRMAQMRPGNDPIGALARALAAPGVLFDKPMTGALSGEALVESTLRLGSLGLIDMVEQADLPSGTQVLVVADQFEELFRFRSLVRGARRDGFGAAEDGVAFVQLLLEAAAQTTVPIYVVLTMRSDFLGDCDQFHGLPEAMNEGQYLVPRLTRNEIRAAITGPAAVRGATLSPMLVTRLLNDVGDNPDQLSILQHALNRTWARWENEGGGKGPLDLPHYEAIGTMAHALDQHAERAYAEPATPRQQKICEKLFKALTDKATDPRGVRRPTTLGTLYSLADATAAEVTEVIDVFRKPSRSFLMPPAGEALTAETIIDISHESLMRVWQRLDTWADEEAQSAQMYRRLADTAALHAAGKAGLWRDPDLQLALDWRDKSQPNETWASRYGSGFNDACAFLRDSETAYAVELEKEKERQQAEAERQARERELEQTKALAEAQRQRADDQAAARIRQRRLMWGLVVALGLAVGAAGFGWYQKLVAEDQKLVAEKQARIAREFWMEADKQATLAKELAKKLGLLADQQTLAAERQTTLAENANKQRVRAEVLSKMSSSREIATNAAQHLQANPEFAVELATKALREAATPQAEGALQQAMLAFRLPRRIFQGMQSDEIVRITPDIAVVRSRSDSKVRLHNITAGGQPIVIDARGPTSLIVVSPNGKYVVIPDSETSVGVWETTTGKPVAGPLRLEEGLNRAFFSAHGKLLGLMTKAGKLGLWETETWRPLPSVGDLLSTTPVFSSDSNYFTARGGDKRLRVWETATGQAVTPIGDDAIEFSTALFSPGGKYIAATSPKRAPSLWSTKLERIGDIGDSKRPVDRVVAFSPNDSQLVTTASDGVRIWSIDNAGALREIKHFEPDKPGVPVRMPEFTQDGSHLITTASDGVRIWSIDNAGALREIKHFEPDKPGVPVRMPEFTQDGKSMLTIAGDVIRIWRSPFDKHTIELKGHAGGVTTARFSQDGRWIVSTSVSDGTAKLWDAIELADQKPDDVITRRVVANFPVGSISDALLSADSRRLLTTSRDGTVRIWDTIEFGSVTALSELPENKKTIRLLYGLDSAAIARNGKHLLAIGSDDFARIWDTATGHLMATLGDGEHKAKRVFLSANGQRAITTGRDNTGRVWDVETGVMLASLPGIDDAELVVAAFSDDAHPWTLHTGGIIRVWSLKGDKPSIFSSIPPLRDPNCVTVSPKVSWVVTCEQVEEQKEGAGEKKEQTAFVRVRQLIPGKEAKEVQQLRGHTGQIEDVFFSQDGRFAVSTSYDKTAKLWDVSSWQTIATLSGHTAPVKLAFFSPDTKYVVTAADDNTARIWETTKGTLISELRGHTDLIKTLAFSGNGLWLATGSEDHTVRVWDIKTGKAVGELYGHRGPVIAVAFSQDPREIISASADGTIIRYRCAYCIPAAELQAIAQQRLKANGKLAESAPQR